MMSRSLLGKFLFTIIIFFHYSVVLSADIVEGKDKAKVCQGCHGSNGISQNPQYPNLAGQRAMYIESQLTAFQSGDRISSIMQNISAKLTKQEIKNISAYYASISSKQVTNDSSPTKGKEKVTMCFGCHGAAAKGQGGIPKLAGQQPEYLKVQLLNFKSSTRNGGPMNAIATSLSEQDIKDIANYLGNL